MTVDVLVKARCLRASLEDLRDMVEHTVCPPEEKSALTRELVESQARVDAVIRAFGVSR
jgi:hypothetical protein